MKANLAALAIGALFGLGLAVSGMTNPAKVLGFLDITGRWDPTLAVVMGAGLLVNLIGYRLTLGRPGPAFSPAFQIPTRKDIDMPLIVGAVLFGLGWGIGGFCPGPAIAALGLGGFHGDAAAEPRVVVFVLAMLVGMALYAVTVGRTRK